MICHFPLRSRFRHSFSLCATGRFLGRILFAFFFICTLAGCKGTSPDAQDKVPADTASFPSFLVDVFQEYAASDSLSLHYTLQNPELLQITEPEITLGHFGKDTLLAGNRTATVSSPAVTSSGTPAFFGRIIVSGPGQKASARRQAASGMEWQKRSICAASATWRIRGLS